MRVLLIAYHFPPDPAVGGIRALKIARAFRAAGHDVEVVAATISQPETATGIPVHRVTSGAGLRQLLVYLQRRGPSGAKPASNSAVEADAPDGYAAPQRLAAWKRFVFSLMWLPDDRQGFIRPAVRIARALPRPDLIYSTAPPQSIHLVGRLTKRALRRPWIAEFRDPWTDNPSKPPHVRSRFSDWIERILEKWVLGAADAVVAVSAANARALTAKMNRMRSSVSAEAIVFRNGIDRVLDGPPPDRKGPIRIVYVGDLYLHRDPLPFLRGLARLLATDRVRRGSVVVDLYGSCRYFHDVSIETATADLGLSDTVFIHDRVAHDRVPSILAAADVLLLLAQKQPAQVPNKLYEYLGARRTVLAFLDREGESADMLREAGSHFLVYDEDPAAIEIAIESSIRSARSGTPVQVADIEHLSAQHQFEALVRMAEGLVR